MARRQWWVLALGLLTGVACAWILFVRSAPVYSATASVLVQPLAGATVNLQTEAEVARSTEIALAAAAELGTPTMPTVLVEALPQTSVLQIRFEAGAPALAQAGALAFAQAYLKGRAQAAEGDIQRLNALIAERSSRVAEAKAKLAAPSTRSSEVEGLELEVGKLTTEILSLTARTTDLTTTWVNPGRIIGAPELPTEPVRPYGWTYLAWGCVGGLGLGFLGAITRDRVAVRIRHGADVVRRHGLPVLVELAIEDPAAGLAEPRVFNRMRNEIAASLGPDDRIIIVAGAAPGAASTVVAANLAAAFARADIETVLVGANAPEIGDEAMTLSHIFDVADIPGLTDVLTSRASLTRALQRAARTPRLRVVTPGGTASAGGLLQSEGARGAMHALRRLARFVVVEAPSASAGADAQSLAVSADAAIVVVEVGRTRHAQLADAAAQMRLVGTRLLGVALLSRTPAAEAAPLRPVSYHMEATPELDEWLVSTRRALDAPTQVLKAIESPASEQTSVL